MMFIDGAPNDGSVSLRLHTRSGKKHFAKDLSGKLKFSVSGIWVTYTSNVYNVSDRKEEHRKVFKVGKYSNKQKAKVAEIFISNETLSYLSLSGRHLVAGIEVEKIISNRDVAIIKLKEEDIIVDEPRAIKTIGLWNDKESKAIDFRITGRYLSKQKNRVDSKN